MYSFAIVDAFSLDAWGQIMSYTHCLKLILSFPTFLGGGAAFVKPGKGRPKVSSGPLRMIKIS